MGFGDQLPGGLYLTVVFVAASISAGSSRGVVLRVTLPLGRGTEPVTGATLAPDRLGEMSPLPVLVSPPIALGGGRATC